MKIQSLLNPYRGHQNDRRNSRSPTPVPQHSSMTPTTSTPKRSKIPKDAAIFTEGSKPIGAVNFPPYETGDNVELAAQHHKFRIHPIGDIGKYVRHIPYNSEKKDFLTKTGREAFEVFQYTFKMPGEEREYVVLWDYNIGLVRVTPFFKCLKYSKTTPAKVLNLNSGLRDICYSITGGALVGQGYWMPYQAARAVAATFCYTIRYALTPVFGEDFPSTCLHPKDPGFAKFAIDPAIVRECTEDTHRWCRESKVCTPPSQVRGAPPSTPPIPFSSPFAEVQKKGRSKQAYSESGYGTDTDASDKYMFSPQVSPRSHATQWTAINRSLSPTSQPAYSPGMLMPSPFPNLVALPSIEEPGRSKRTLSKAASNIDEEDVRPSTAASTDAPSMEPDEHFVDTRTDKEIEAAEIMLLLQASDNSLRRPKRTRRGSRY
ncbi:DNA-binding domain of Mlu1-box binding protein MBP1 [Amniculicola lignicola CBS 123094]|uniref:DNA-binding domain of Mlu1-box binding protein MBP1 n=1 Tax=Amniculicola lignicola CBS 123094 TaxID=1392246 RepID=A0A6A5WNU5_9PLEO|nr:DNA-binding domain of Mlu1-box binding protein MBP1 [Amniculicola lignicola CBS 123094]